jgi:pimeloyl-ACP methyl ester carboxylesterase
MKTKAFVLAAVAIIAVVVFAVVFPGYKKDLAAARENIGRLQTQIFPWKHGDMEYRLAGEGPIVLISHGVTGGVDQGIGLARMYLGEGYRCLYVSRFGYLKSAMPGSPSVKLQAEAYKDLLGFLGIERAFILGNSAGGTSAIQFALDYPEKCQGLILISSNVPGNKAGAPPKAVFRSDFLYWGAIRLAGRAMMAMFIPKPIIRSLSGPEKRKLIDDLYVSAMPISRRTKGILFDLEVSNPAINGDIPFENIAAPALIIHAVDDPAPPIAGARLIAGRIPNGELAAFETGGHLILNHDGEIKEKIRAFIFR